MRKIEVKEVKIVSAFKTTVYVSIIPLGFMLVIGILFTIFAALLGETSLLALGIPYIVLPLILLGFYGVFSMLMALVYNLFSKKFGGLEVTISDKEIVPNFYPNDTANMPNYNHFNPHP